MVVLKSVELPQCKSGRKPQAARSLFYQYFLVEKGAVKSRER